MNAFKITLIVCLGLYGGMLAQRTRADDFNKKSVFTFTQPVEIPGKVLPAGTYVFKQPRLEVDPRIVQVYNLRENHLIATLKAVPEIRRGETEEPVVTFEKRAQGAPEAVKAWFYPGTDIGDELIYPKLDPGTLAGLNHVPGASLPAQVTTKAAPGKKGNGRHSG